MSDERLFVRYAEGDGSAFRMLMDRYAVHLLRYCRGFVDTEDEAEDLVQETFLRAIKSAATYRATARFSAWIYTIARNLCLDRLKARRTRTELWKGREADIAASTTGTTMAHTAAVGGEISQPALEEALAALTRLEAETVRLTFYAEWTTGQIARLQNCSRSTVRVRRHQALEKLRVILLGVGNEHRDKRKGAERHE